MRLISNSLKVKKVQRCCLFTQQNMNTTFYKETGVKTTWICSKRKTRKADNSLVAMDLQTHGNLVNITKNIEKEVIAKASKTEDVRKRTVLADIIWCPTKSQYWEEFDKNYFLNIKLYSVSGTHHQYFC